MESGNLSRMFYRVGGCDMFARYGKKQTRGSRMREVEYRHMYWLRCCAVGARVVIFICMLKLRCYRSVQNLLSSSLLSKTLKIKIYRTIILPVVLCGCETWSLTLREEHRLRVFDNRLLRRIFGPKRDGVAGEWRKLRGA